MIRVNTADFRASMSSYLDRAIGGEQVMITRKNQMFMLTPVEPDELLLTPEVEARIAHARQEIADGNGMRFDNKKDMNSWLDSI